MKFRKPLSYAVVLAFIAQSALAEDLIGSGSVSLTNLRYRLVDLNPADGIAPSVTFIENPKPIADCCLQVSSGGGVETNSAFSGLPFSDSNLTLLAANGTAVAGVQSNGDVMVKTGFTANSVGQLIATAKENPYGWKYDPTRANATNGDYFYSDSSSHSGWSLDRASFTLSPFTSITFEGDLAFDSKSLKISDAQLADINNFVKTNVGSSFYFSSRGSFYSSLVLEGIEDELLPNSSTFKQNNYSLTTFTSDGVEVTDGGHYGQPFSLTLSNNFSISKKGDFIYGLESASDAIFNGGVPPIPEPSTLALHGLGLSFVALAVVRQRRKRD